MKFAHKFFTTALCFSVLGLAQPLMAASYPAIYYVRKTINTTVDGCMSKATRIMHKEGLTNVRNVDDNDVFGHNANSNVGIACINEGENKIRVTITVAGNNSDEAKTLLETLKSEISP